MRKDFIFRNYVRLASVSALIAISVIYRLTAGAERLGFIGTSVAAALSFCYFVQKQKLDELILFQTLFAKFNERYELLNDDLEDMLADIKNIDFKQRKKIVSYFNLCAEEYLFYDEGFIHRAVWRSWCLGMNYYLKDPRIRKIWDEEVTQDSYYGLTLEVIKAGTNLPRTSNKN